MLLKSKRNQIRSKDFSLPSERKYPIIDRDTALSAIRLSSLQHKKGNLSRAGLQTVHHKAYKFLQKHPR